MVLSQNEEDVKTAVREGIVAPSASSSWETASTCGASTPRAFRGHARLVRASLGIADDAPVVGFVGRLVAEKGLRELLEAARLVRERVPAVVLLLVGGSDEEKAGSLTPDAAREAGVAEACVFTGVRHDMPELYRAMDLFALPSHREGFPRAPMEAAAMGLPCVLTDVRGCRQVVTHGRNGLLVPVGDPACLAEALVLLLTAPALARRMGDEGRRRARRRVRRAPGLRHRPRGVRAPAAREGPGASGSRPSHGLRPEARPTSRTATPWPSSPWRAAEGSGGEQRSTIDASSGSSRPRSTAPERRPACFCARPSWPGSPCWCASPWAGPSCSDSVGRAGTARPSSS